MTADDDSAILSAEYVQFQANSPSPLAPSLDEEPQSIQEFELESPRNTDATPVIIIDSPPRPAAPVRDETYEVALTLHHIQPQQSATWLFRPDATIEDVRTRCEHTWHMLFVCRCGNVNVDIGQPVVPYDPTINHHHALSISPYSPHPAPAAPPAPRPSGRTIIGINVYHVRTGQQLRTYMPANTCAPSLLGFLNNERSSDFRLRYNDLDCPTSMTSEVFGVNYNHHSFVLAFELDPPRARDEPIIPPVLSFPAFS